MVALTTRSESFQRSTWSWRLPKFDAFPPPVRALAIRRLQDLDRTDYTLANRSCLELARKLTTAHVGKAFDETELRDCAENYARTCARLSGPDPDAVLERLGGVRRFSACDGPVTWLPVQSPSYASQMRAFGAKAAFAASVGLDVIPANRSNRFFGLSARLDDPLWWRRQLRKMWSRQSEQALRDLGAVRKGADVYASESAVRLRADQQRRMRQFLKACVAVNEHGEVLPLEQIAEKSLSNPGLRRGELMARIKGFEKVADRLKWEAIFATVTAPSAFHPQLFHGGANPRYTGATVRQAQEWLCTTWSRVRSQLDRDGVKYFGFRVAEPHHDGTPHWHVLLFVKKGARKQLSRTIVSGWLQEFGNEPGAYQKRVTIERIDRRRGSATGYLAKYIAKNLDAAGVVHAQAAHETGLGARSNVDHGLAVQDGLARVLAWAAVHGIRQFQQLGGPPVGVYREARRIRQPVSHPDLERARGFADRGDWRGFCLASGYRFLRDGADVKLDQLWRAQQRARRRAGLPPRRRFKTSLRLVYADTGRRNRYGELVGAQHIGLNWGGGGVGEIFTRPHQWRITTQGGSSGETVQKDSSHTHAAADIGQLSASIGHASRVSASPPLGPVAITVRTETDRDEPAERFYSGTQALIRQLACRMRLSADPDLREKWSRESAIPRFDPAYWCRETTGPPH